MERKIIKLKCNSATCENKITDHEAIEITGKISGTWYKCLSCTMRRFEPEVKK